MSHKSYPRLIFGTASFGDAFLEPHQVQSVLDLLHSHHIMHFDTAGRYPPTKYGRSEELLGQVKAAEQGFTIDTKILATRPDGIGEMTRERIEESVSTSLQRLGIDKINVLYIHRHDPQTPLEEQAATLDALHRQGKFTTLGISNFKPDILAAYLAICRQSGFVTPAVYQGNYSIINRGTEKHIFPILRQHGIVFNAYGCLAAGFLSGSATYGSKEGTRFGSGGYMSQYLHNVYDNASLHDAQRKLAKSTDELGITPIEAALRWAMYHSALREGDGIILGASRESQIVSNIKSLENGPLPDSLVADIQEIWDELKAEREDSYIF